MGDFAGRLRFAITNYADGAITYKAFAGLVDIPYRTLQNYLNGERSPNIEALQKFAANGLNVGWLVTGEGEPYKHLELERQLLDTLFLQFGPQIIRDLFDKKNTTMGIGDKYLVLSFIMSKNYLGIGDVLHSIIDGLESFDMEEFGERLATGEFDARFELPPRNHREVWRALQTLKDYKKARYIPPFPFDLSEFEPTKVGE